MHLDRSDGGISIVGLSGEDLSGANPSIAADLPKDLGEITFIAKSELDGLSDELQKAALEVDLGRLYPLGVRRQEGKQSHTAYLWNAGYLFRKKAKLASVNPIFVVPPGKLEIEPLIQKVNTDTCSIEFLEHITFALLHEGKLALAFKKAIQLCERAPHFEKGWLRLGDIALKSEKFKLSMLSYGRVLHLDTSTKLVDYAIRGVKLCASHTEWGQVLTEQEAQEIPRELLSWLMDPWVKAVRNLFIDTSVDGNGSFSRMNENRPVGTSVDGLPNSRLPSSFRWLVPFQIALSSAPSSQGEIEQLETPQVGIRHIISLTEVPVIDSNWLRAAASVIKLTQVPIPESHPPSVEQIDCVMGILTGTPNLPALIHCAADFGQSGIIAACYVAAYGLQSPKDPDAMPIMQATEAVRLLSATGPMPGETPTQEEIVSRWLKQVWRRKSVLPFIVDEPLPCSLEIIGHVPQDADLLVFVGLQGSGKTWVARALRARNPDVWRRVSQDESGSRSTSEGELGRNPLGKRVILDRCNPSSSDRAYWRKLAHWAKQPVLVWFDYTSDLCISRAQRRLDHPTLTPGSRVRTAVNSTAAQFEPPVDPTTEGFMGMAVIRSFAASAELVSLLSPPVHLFKFPRTAHLLDLGAATEDDVHTTDSQLAPSLSNELGSSIVITEKIDGANLGISLDADCKIVIQNRSHWVNSKTHFQFKRLDLWVEEHREGLHAILARDDTFWSRYILFGEWLVCTHSIHYSRLPNHFLAFDLYDRTTGTFASRGVLESLVLDTGIHLVPTIEVRRGNQGTPPVIPTHAELKAMVQMPSQFYDGRVEGVYVKVEDASKVLGRGKVVRGDFIAGNEHWTRGVLTLNGIIGRVQ